jgi:uncharacterized protein (TIGR03435 family)
MGVLTVAVICALGNSALINAQSPVLMSAPSSSMEGFGSVKVNRSGDTSTLGQYRLGVQFPPGRFIARSATPEVLIELAYDVLGFQLAGEPSWIKSEKYDVDAKIEDLSDGTPTPPEDRERKRRLVIQSILSERFKLKVSHEPKNLPLYALVIAQNDPKLASTTLKPSGSANLNSDKRRPGPMMKFSRGELTMTDAPLSKLARELSRQLGCKVLDKTGLEGNYDLTLSWQPENRGQISNGAEDRNHSGPSIFDAVQEQLGLKLEPQTGPVEIVTIVHIEKPSEN